MGAGQTSLQFSTLSAALLFNPVFPNKEKDRYDANR